MITKLRIELEKKSTLLNATVTQMMSSESCVSAVVRDRDVTTIRSGFSSAHSVEQLHLRLPAAYQSSHHRSASAVTTLSRVRL